ncbi:glycosyl transferase [Amylibacter marinus]|uniref:Glycosyl transferase n=1 Tax=Amylibacter marinus TaxID=1475483 RepID=A0ABQ5VS02_9RHOB|nr:TIGR04283 family arsenosugar biosynthesis glycosyltransferase [Amylibacter marinus]GLQ33883.1 glycosyl transferase [Amylibacter marinus]
MPAPLSIVIPTLNVAHHITPTLRALIEGLNAGLVHELIFADGGSDDNIQHIADEIGARIITAPMGRGTQLDAGVSAARGAWVLVIHADTILAEGWSSVLEAHIASKAHAGYGQLCFDSGHFMARVTAKWANLRARLFDMPYGDQGLLISKRLYNAVGGYAPVPIMEDVLIAQALKGQMVALNFTAQTSAIRYERAGWLRQGLRNIILVARFKLGASPEVLAQKYRASTPRKT